MAGEFTYSGDPSRNDRDAVRFWLGDTQKARPLLIDTEIDFVLAETPDVKLAAAECADHLMARFTREADVSVGSVSKSLSKVAEAYKALAEHLRCEAGKLAGVEFPALSKSKKRAADLRTDDVQPETRLGLGDNPFAVQINDAIDDVRFFNGFS